MTKILNRRYQPVPPHTILKNSGEVYQNRHSPFPTSSTFDIHGDGIQNQVERHKNKRRTENYGIIRQAEGFGDRYRETKERYLSITHASDLSNGYTPKNSIREEKTGD